MSIPCTRIGIPIEKVGEKIKKLNEAIKADGMAINADSKINVALDRNERALSVTLEVYLFGEEEEGKDEI